MPTFRAVLISGQWYVGMRLQMIPTRAAFGWRGPQAAYLVSSEGLAPVGPDGAITLFGLLASGLVIGFVGSTGPVDGPAALGLPVVGPGALTGASVAASGTREAAFGPVI
jgi:hypothetical protein